MAATPTHFRDNYADEDDEITDDGSPSKQVHRNCILILLCSDLIQGKFDNELEEVAARILEKYPPGRCSSHLDVSCFHHRPSDFHFDIGERHRLLVWAAAIVSSFIHSYMIMHLSLTVTESRHSLI